MYFKKFPEFLYDFNYGNRIKTSIVKDITRNIRLRRDILANVTLYDEVDIIDGETPEVISEKFYGTPDYHWVVMLCNEKYDYRKDFPVPESVLSKHIADIYNPTLTSSDWYWDTHDDGLVYFHIRITSTAVPFDPAYLTALIQITLRDDDRSFVVSIDSSIVGLDVATQYFYFPLINHSDAWLVSHGKEGSTADAGIGNVPLYIETGGREFNPVYFVNTQGNIINPTDGAIPITGDIQHRYENDMKRRIKLISPSLLETILRNYEDEL